MNGYSRESMRYDVLMRVNGYRYVIYINKRSTEPMVTINNISNDALQKVMMSLPSEDIQKDL